MNDAWGYDDNAAQQAGNNDGPAALREAYKAQKAANDAIMAELAAIKAERAKDKLSSVFSELGVPGAVDLYQGEPDVEKAKAWAESMKAAFGTSNTQGATTPVDVPPVLSPEDQAAYQALSQAGASTGTPMGSTEAAGLAIQNATSLEELIAANQASQHLR